MDKFVSRSFFVAALLIPSCFACGFARAQSQPDFLRANSDSRTAASPSLSLSLQFPATDDSLTVAPSLVQLSFTPLSAVDPGNVASYSPLVATSAGADALPSRPAAASHPLPAPKPKPKTYYYENPNKWQLGLAFALVRFRSSIYSATAPGLNSSLAYWWKEWVAIESSVTSAFAPPVFANEHFRYLSYGAGPKFSFGHGRLEPWADALVGGAHIVPQTAAGGQNGFEFTMGAGVDYVLNDVISAKGGVDYLGTHMFGAWQSSIQFVAGASLRF